MLEPILDALRRLPARHRAERRRRSLRLQPHRHASSPTPRRPTRTTGSRTCAARCASPTASPRSRSEPDRVYLEVGPGKALSSLTQAHGGVPAQPGPELAAPPRGDDRRRRLLPRHRRPALGDRRRRSTGSRSGAARGARACRCRPTPSSARPTSSRRARRAGPGGAERGRCAATTSPPGAGARSGGRGSPSARSTSRRGCDGAAPQTWLVFVDDAGLGARVVARLRAAGHRVVEVHPGDAFAPHRRGPLRAGARARARGLRRAASATSSRAARRRRASRTSGW